MDKMPEKRHFSVGNVVKVKSWDRMKHEFQLWNEDTIMTPSGEFYSDMKPLCGMTFSIGCIGQTFNGRIWYLLDDQEGGCLMRRLTGHSDWIFTEDMLEPVNHGAPCTDDNTVVWFGGWEFVQ